MYIEVKENVKTIKELIEFLSKFPHDTRSSLVSFETPTVIGLAGAFVSVMLIAEDVEQIECGDHIVKPGGEYPKDLLVTLHDHA